MWKTVVLLIIGIVLLPLGAYYFDSDSLSLLQKETLHNLVWIYLIAAGLCFLISTITKNYSQVDKLWSIMPIIYAWVTCHMSGYEPRLVLMAILVTIWGVRLSYNFARRGGYQWKFWEGEEDYRWEVLRAKPEFQSPIRWMLFNLFFISYYQMGLILLFTLPIVRSMESGPLCWLDGLLAFIILVLILIELIADQQQWEYQKEKYRLKNENLTIVPPYDKGFIEYGLWGKSRHPNYAAEQSIWIVFYIFSVVATGLILNWSIIGCVLLLILFKSSSDFSEEISAQKYPEYKNYQKRVSRFWPWVY